MADIASPAVAGTRPFWSSRTTFVLAAAGAAVGLGNVWKFPYIAGEYGGGAFVLVYVLFIVTIGLPVLLAELLIGRRVHASPVTAVADLVRQAGASPRWRLMGYWPAVLGPIILSFYSVIGGWTLAYLWRVLTATGPVDTQAQFARFLADPLEMLGWHSLFILATVLVVQGGLRRGIERATNLAMPTLLTVLVALLVHTAATSPSFAEGAAFLLKPDFGALTLEGVMAALGHAFFTLSVGLGVMLAYATYLPADVSLPKAAVAVAGLDTAVAIGAGLIIFPIVFASGLEPGAGPGLIFVTLPEAFAALPGGRLLAAVFFLLLFFAALTSAIAGLEPAVQCLEDATGAGRPALTAGVSVVIWALGIVTVLSFNVWADATWMGRTPFDWIDFIAANVALPLGGLMFCLFAGHMLSRRIQAEELAGLPAWALVLWRMLVRYVAPLGIVIVLSLKLIGAG